jgi:hypothetical protein
MKNLVLPATISGFRLSVMKQPIAAKYNRGAVICTGVKELRAKG